MSIVSIVSNVCFKDENLVVGNLVGKMAYLPVAQLALL